MPRSLTVFAALLFAPAALAQAPDSDLITALRSFDSRTALSPEQAKEFAEILPRDLRIRRAEANQQDIRNWLKRRSKENWQQSRRFGLDALRDSLGPFPPKPSDVKVRPTRVIKGEGFEVENLIYESRPGVLVTANLYRPQKTPVANAPGSPGILIVHSHHNPKTQGELQDMGMTWSRAGCYVLIPDQLGHGERRQHPFVDKASYQGDFKPGRQDYYFRYNVGLQLHLVGESLMGWMVWDMMRGVDVLLTKPGIDPKRIILLGSVAGGGDPCAVTAALDERIAAAVPFNFGGPQPETKYPLPEDAEISFNYIGGGSWESTRGLRQAAWHPPWLIVAAIAPRGLIYAHEFAWDKDRDPVWKRLNTVYGYFGSDRLAFAYGRGKLTGQPPESTHCNNIGAEHRKMIYPTLQKWFNMPIPQEYQKRLSAEELTCVPANEKLAPLHQTLTEIATQRVAAARDERAKMTGDKSLKRPAEDWHWRLGHIRFANAGSTEVFHEIKLGDSAARRFVVHVWREGGVDTIPVPVVLLTPRHGPRERLPVVVAISQEGKDGFLKKRAETIAALLNRGVAVCLPDLRGTGETKPPGDSRGRASISTSLSASEQMLMQSTMLGWRLSDLRSVLEFLRGRQGIDSKRIALWGDSFAPENPPDRNLAVPLDAAKMPDQAEPLGGLLALFAALYEKDIRAVYARGGLVSYASVLESPFIYLPHDVIVPGALTAGDLCDVAAALAPRAVRLEGCVDSLNRRCTAKVLANAYMPTAQAYRAAKAEGRFVLREQPSSPDEIGRWLHNLLAPRP